MKNTRAQQSLPPAHLSPQPVDPFSSAETFARLLRAAECELEADIIDTPRIDAEVLLAHVLGVSRAALYTKLQDTVSVRQVDTFRQLLTRRKQHEPVAYITGEQEFWSLEFQVDSRVLIPRPDTEVVVETALRLLRSSPLDTPHILDIGTGSGCIAIALATQLPQAKLWAIDQAADALSLANQNAASHQISDRVVFSCADLFPLQSGIPTSFDLIVSNPPYIPSGLLKMLQPDVREWEPRSALDGGADGLDFYRRLLYESPDRIRPGGWLVVEIGEDQKDAVRQLGDSQRNLLFHTCVQDYAGRDRVVVFQKTA